MVRVVFLSQFYDIIKNGKKEYLGEKAEKTPFKTIKKLYESSKCYVIWGHNLLKKTVKTAKNCRNTYLTEILTQQKYLPNRDIVELGNDRIEIMLTYINICLC